MKKLSIALLALALVAPVMASAQQSANITATATVNTPLTVTGVNNLAFGTVFPGINPTVAVSSANAGHFQIAGVSNAEVQVSFSALPASLSGPGPSLAISYAGVWNPLADPVTGATPFTPVAGLALTERLGAASLQLHVYLGGTLTVPANQTAGDYSATITMAAAYTGN